MLINRIFLIIIILSFCKSSFCQELIELKLNKQVTNSPFKPSVVVTKRIVDSNNYKIPLKCDNYLLKSFSIYNRFGESIFKNIGFYDSKTVSILINNNSDSSKIVIADTNFDNDFTNDKIILFDKNKSLNEEYFTIELIHQNDKINYYFKPIINQQKFKYFDKNEQEHYLLIEPFEKYQGCLNIGNNVYTFLVKNDYPSPYFYKNNIQIGIKLNNSEIEFFKNDDYIKLKDINITVDSILITGEKIFLKIHKKEADFKEIGFNKDFMLQPFILSDFNSKEVKLPSESKYTLMDFWGTWCAPCLELTPRLVEINKQFKDKITLISLASNSPLQSVRDYTKKENMNWINIVENDNNKMIFSKDMFNVSAFPTFILINENGKILFRNTGKDGLEEIVKYLNNN
jgi:thiol-disulfide isomerase/thioredoxin